MSDHQCPVCLKQFSSGAYLHKHIFKNKRKCVSPEGHNPPFIDYEKETITWPVPTPTPTPTPKPKIIINCKNTPPTTSGGAAAPTSAVAAAPVPVPSGDQKKMTITVDASGNIIQLPNIENHNEFIETNPALFEQIKQIVQKLNLPQFSSKSSTEIDQHQKDICLLIERFGDLKYLIERGLAFEMKNTNVSVAINFDEELNMVYVEKVALPDQWHKRTNRDESFIEILYRGMYSIFSDLISNKYHFFEHTHSLKAFNDCRSLMKYRKCLLTSLMVLKYRLDKGNTESNDLKEYLSYLTDKQFPHVHLYDDCFLAKFKMAGQLNPVELMSIMYFYENLLQLVHIDEKNARFSYLKKDTSPTDTSEASLKEPPTYRLINLEKIPIEYLLCPDYSYEIVSRDFYSILVKITPKTYKLGSIYQNYCKRIYLDGSCDAPSKTT